MKIKGILICLLIVMHATINLQLFAHCQIPCGIYDDPLRISLMLEHVLTIEKSMKEIEKLSSQEKPEWNQLVRWIQNKESHADQLTEIVTYYFMAQRIKPVGEKNSKDYQKYLDELKILHEIIIIAMKTKQTVDLNLCYQLHVLIDRFKNSYFESQKTLKKMDKNTHEHH